MSYSDTMVSFDVSRAFERAATLMEAAFASNTKRVYQAGWRAWEDWCRAHHTAPSPAAPQAVAAFLAQRADAGRAVASIQLALAAIQHGNRVRGHQLDRKHPIIAAVMAGIARTYARPIDCAPALELEDLRTLIASIEGDDVRACRDRALFITSFFGALRRSEAAALDLTGRSPIELRPSGVRLNLTATKTCSQTQAVTLPARSDELCPVAAIRAYVRAASIDTGPLWRALSKSEKVLPRRLSETGVSHVLRQRLSDSAALSSGGFSSHSWRAGYVSSAIKRGAPEALVAAVSRHKSTTVLRGYVRIADQYKDNASNWLDGA